MTDQEIEEELEKEMLIDNDINEFSRNKDSWVLSKGGGQLG
jgi:hypothetical protein